ncbi:nucleotide-binding protein [Paenibacillus polymyxa]|uniref:nucleotide-binding protein n=1 Tax=Paenibacillus polymyxa TaxID=1406 RepID=UPI0025B666F2|nr:nucleotide-binding protein [Paenibacillus polymyxa]MDN4083285.1 nucleotide-binding protein [Paenibacillus polymyxa]MDN4089594.1 nucleotide-binding protein [Paenibacillus polymyxa]MDN4110262.1 nucleotide-binding protein [Paenibacillus polymyxa]
MNKAKHIKLLNELIERTEKLSLKDSNEKDSVERDAKMIIRNIFGAESSYISDLDSISFHLFFAPAPLEEENRAWFSGQRSLINLLNTVKRELELFNQDEEDGGEMSAVATSNKVFLVHGHDDGMKYNVARTLEKLNLEAIILHEMEDGGKTIIEKFEINAVQCNCAIVLLSPDDIAHPKTDSNSKKFRARQNVIFELGYFIGRLGRKKVLTLVKDDPTDHLEIPSDFAGVVYTQYDDSSEGWKGKLVKALKSNGYNIDANVLF